MVHLGKDFLRWERPATASLPLAEGQRLLATGEVVESSKEGGAIAKR
jgi:hypothetical protein